MEAIWSLMSRHNKVFMRNRMLVFFSLLSVIIVIGLYAVFLQQTQLDAIKQVVPVTGAITVMVNEWMVAGLLSMIAVTTTLATFGIYVRDLETKVTADFLTTAVSRTKIQLSYVLSALIIGFMMSVIAFILCEIFLVVSGANVLGFVQTLKIIGVLLLSVLLSSTINLLIVLFVKTQNTFSTINTIIGTMIGFLCGVYVPIGALPSYVQSIIHVFPVSHTTVLLRQLFMDDSIDTVFANSQQATDYMLQSGVQYEIGTTILTPFTSVLIIIGTTIVVGIIAVLLFTRRNK